MDRPVEHRLADGPLLTVLPFDPSPDRLLALFDRVWARIPKQDRDRLGTYVAPNRPETCVRWAIELHDHLCKDYNRFAETSDAGTTMWFSASALSRMDDATAMWIIAHETAHRFQYALCLEAQRIWDNSDTENEADQIGIRWGFAKERDAKEAWRAADYARIFASTPHQP